MPDDGHSLSEVDILPPETRLPETPPNENSASDLCLVGIGASAGGLEALMELVATLPNDVQAAYVVVQHMSPMHKSLLSVLLARETALEVKEIVDGVRPVANTIYVTPPKTDIVYGNGALKLVNPSANVATSHPSVDRFFVSLAEELGEQAVGIVLSGTGTDGSLGVQAIHSAGGVTIAQDAGTAKFSGMPVAALETGFVDLVLAPDHFGTRLTDIMARPRNLVSLSDKSRSEDTLTELLQIVLARSQVDFRDYKTTMILRRLERRLVALSMSDIKEYIKHCRTYPSEIDALVKDFLISVTQFFRDKTEFETLGPYIEELAKSDGGADGGKVIRIWIAGCATGEEAYSVAMLLAETIGIDALRSDRVQIFATDIDKGALAKARLGRYPQSAAEDIPPHLFEKYVDQVDDMIEMVPALRDIILFSEHNLCQDPPFLNVDLICCRNLLIYFNTTLQSKVLGRMHYSLDPNGLLFLGIAESISVSGELFRSLGSENKFYRKRKISRAQERARTNDFSKGVRTRPRTNLSLQKSSRRDVSRNGENQADISMFEGLVRSIGPNSILVTGDMRIVRVFGDISPYISLNEGMRLQLSTTMLRPPLNQDAHMLACIALKRREHRNGSPKRLMPEAQTMVRMDAYPIFDTLGPDPLVLLTFTNTTDHEDKSSWSEEPVGEARERVLALERDLNFARDTLHETIEELETSNDELQSLHEEMQSTNEDLQATNGELETSNEELQSTNEELITVNEELQISSMELSAVSDEQDAILENVAAALLIIDSALQVVKASSEAVQLFSMTQSFTRPHLSQIKTPKNFPSMTDICLDVIQNGHAVTRDIATADGIYVMRCAPYSNNKGQVLGATMIIARSSEASELQSMMLKESKQLIMHRSGSGDILRISEHSAKLLGAKTSQTLVGRNLIDAMGDGANAILLEDRNFLESGELVRLTEQNVELPTGARRYLRMERFRFQTDPDRPPSVYSVALDITAERLAKQNLLAHNEQLTMVSDIAKIGYWMIDLGSGDITWSPEVYDIHGLSPEEFTPDLGAGLSFYHPDDRGRVTEMVDAAIKDGEPFEFSARIVRPDGELAPVHASCRIIPGDDGAPLHIVGVFSRA